MSIILKTIVILLFPVIVFSAEIAADNFEAGGSWDYDTKWTNTAGCYDSTTPPAWDIVTTSPHAGTYCAESNQPHRSCNGQSTLPYNSSNFYLTGLSGYSELFVRFWFKGNTNLTCDWAQFTRLYGTSGDIEIGPTGYQTGTRTGSDCGVINASDSAADIFPGGSGSSQATGWGNPYVDSIGTWVEYALYINYSENKFYFWKNASNYTTEDPGFNSITATFGSWRVSALLLPTYYKSLWADTYGSELFWVDDVDILDGLPDSGSSEPTMKGISGYINTN